MKKLSLLVFFMMTIVAVATAQMPIYGADSLRRHYQAKADELLVGDTSLNSWFRIDLYSVQIFSEPTDASVLNPKVEYRVNWSELGTYKNMMRGESREDAKEIMLSKGARNFEPAVQKKYSSSDRIAGEPVVDEIEKPEGKPLFGMRIAIDPGHIANDTAMGRIEQKFIYMRVPRAEVNPVYDTVAFAEGQLTWETAAILAQRLRDAGATVMFTRPGPGITAFGKTFEQWKQDDYQRTLDSLLVVDPENQNLKDLKSGKMKTDRSIFRFVFREVELRKRTELINAFRPDLTVVIHYNVDETNAPWTAPTNKNFSMYFVPGSFEAGELDDSESRFDFLRLLLTDDIERSIVASDYVGRKLELKIRAQLAKPPDAAYLSTACRFTRKRGVYARNLTMTRMVHGPIIYGESLYQDNWTECILLNNRTIVDLPSKTMTSSRVISVAEAYYAGILDWADSR